MLSYVLPYPACDPVCEAKLSQVDAAGEGCVLWRRCSVSPLKFCGSDGWMVHGWLSWFIKVASLITKGI